MVICTIYSHLLGLDKIKEVITKVYPRSTLKILEQQDSSIIEVEIKGGLFTSAKKIKISYRQRSVPSYQLPVIDDSMLTRNLKGMYGLVNKLPAKNENVRNLLLRKIETLNCEFSIMQEQGEIKDLENFIQQISSVLGAILFVQPNTSISKSSTQHFLDENLNLIIDNKGNYEVESLEIKIDSAYFDQDESLLNHEQVKRKTFSESILEEREIKVNKNLPCIESEEKTILRTPQEIAQRVSVLAMTNLVAFNTIPADEALEYLRKHNLDQFITANEKDFFTNPTDEKKNHETWKCEGIWTLLWALNKVEHLGFADQMCNLGNVDPDNYPVGADKAPNDFIDSVTGMRSKKEILDMNDLYYRLDWACVDARINNKEITEINPGVVYERHYALNWLINYKDQEWDDVSCDT